MNRTRALGAVCGALFVAIACAAAAGDGGPPDDCPRPAVRRQRFSCRDGNARCDLDEQCDGTCIIAWCGDFVGECLPYRFHRCRAGETPWQIDMLRPKHHARYNEWKAGNVVTHVSVSCRAAPHCTPPPPTCQVTLSGDQNLTSSCVAGLVRENGAYDSIVLRLPTGAVATIELGGVASPGSYGVTPGASFPTMVVDIGDVGFLVTSYFGGSIDLRLDEVTPSETAYHRIHGSVSAMLVLRPPATRVLSLQATF